QTDNEVASGGLLGLRSGSRAGRNKEGWVRVAAEMMAEKMKVSDRVAEGSSDLIRGPALEEVGAESLVQAVSGVARLLEEAAALTYILWCVDRHDKTLSYPNLWCQLISSPPCKVVQLAIKRRSGSISSRRKLGRGVFFTVKLYIIKH